MRLPRLLVVSCSWLLVIVMQFLLLLLLESVNAAADIPKPEDDFGGYMEGMSELEAERERYRSMLEQHQVSDDAIVCVFCVCVHVHVDFFFVFLLCDVVIFPHTFLSYIYCKHVAKNKCYYRFGEKRRGVDML